MMAKYDLRDTTFIIPVFIDSDDRRINTKICLSYLCKYLDTNIILYEYDSVSKISEILKTVTTYGNTINHIFCKNEDNGLFHRTLFLNRMLAMVKTPIVVNYDVDVLLLPEVYYQCANEIRGGIDLLYPYGFGDFQYQVNYSGRDKVRISLNLRSLTPEDYTVAPSRYGHCQFFKTSSYRSSGMENEGFVAYAPEDSERGHRLKMLGYNVAWNHSFVYHLEHSRGINSEAKHPFSNHNTSLWEYLRTLDREMLRHYYDNVDYIQKYPIN